MELAINEESKSEKRTCDRVAGWMAGRRESRASTETDSEYTHILDEADSKGIIFLWKVRINNISIPGEVRETTKQLMGSRQRGVMRGAIPIRRI
jgi:hypothetical protein